MMRQPRATLPTPARRRNPTVQNARRADAPLLSKSIELCRVGDQNTLAHSRVRRPGVKQLEQMSSIRHLAFHPGMRPVAAPYQSLRIGTQQRLVERTGVLVIGRTLAQAVGARHLDPAFAVADEAKQVLK